MQCMVGNLRKNMEIQPPVGGLKQLGSFRVYRRGSARWGPQLNVILGSLRDNVHQYEAVN